MTGLSIRIDFAPSGSALGPGMVQLLELVGEKGSIRAAGVSMGMSYRTAWLLVEDIQKTFNGKVVSTTNAGSQLTELGRKIIRLYRDVESRAKESTRQQRKTLAALVPKDAPRRQGRSTRKLLKQA